MEVPLYDQKKKKKKDMFPFLLICQELINQKKFHLPTGQVKKQITCRVEKLACPDSFFQK